MAHSSTPRLVTLLKPSMSLSRCLQKNSGRSRGKTLPFTTCAKATLTLSLLQEAQMKEECMMALTIHTAGAERCLSRSGIRGRWLGSPRSWPVLVVSFLCEYYYPKHRSTYYKVYNVFRTANESMHSFHNNIYSPNLYFLNS